MKGGLEELRKTNFDRTISDMKSLEIGDQLVIQAISMIDELTKVTNRLAVRLGEWLAWGVPEAKRELVDNRKLVELTSSLPQDKLIEDIRGHSKDLPDSFGVKISDEDWKNIQISAKAILSLHEERERLEKSLEGSMKNIAPNIQAVAGTLIGAKLIALAGSLKRVSEMPASTVQLLGAEKALFRHLTTGARCPKHGIILQHPLLAKAKKKDRGRTARAIADKLSIAAKVDYFKGDFVGDNLRKQLEAKLG